MVDTSIFGTSLRDRVLVLLVVKGTSHLREIARIYGKDVSLVQRTLKRLERDGLVVAIAHGRTRLLQLNRRWYAFGALEKLLQEIAAGSPHLYEPASAIRARPRRSGKPL